MSNHIILKLDVTKIVKEWLFKGQKGTYLDVVVYENDATDQFGNSHVVKQSPSKDLRDQGTKPVIIGNGKWMNAGGRGQQAQRPSQSQAPARRGPPAGTIPRPQPQADDGDEIPW
jgi:hypothetical protein